jgi:hypothetical protein
MGEEKEHEQPYLLPPSTRILDDYFFVHREVLAWKFWPACKQDQGVVQCPVETARPVRNHEPAPAFFGALSIEFLGREKVNLKGVQQDLLKLELKTDAGRGNSGSTINSRCMRMSVVGENTEVDRD